MGDVIMGFLYIFQLGAVKNGIFYYLFWCYLYMGGDGSWFIVASILEFI